MKLAQTGSGLRFLGIEGGGTRTVALMADGPGRVLARLEAGPANFKLLTDAELRRHLEAIAGKLPRPAGLGIGLAGAWAPSDRARVIQAAARVWPGVPCAATSDLETALEAAQVKGTRPPLAKVLVLSGTGSACFARARNGTGVKVGGWGHILGDGGSAYDIGLRALRAVIDAYDHTGRWPRLGSRILRAAGLKAPRNLIDWAQAASKTQIAELALEVFRAWSRRDGLAEVVLQPAAESLAEAGVACASKVAAPGARVCFVLAGSNMVKQPRFAVLVGRKLRQRRPGSDVAVLQRESVWGAVEMARRQSTVRPQSAVRRPRSTVREGRAGEMVCSRRLSPTEQRNPRSMDLDRLTVARAIRLMLSEEGKVPARVLSQSGQIERAIRLIVQAFRRGGRLFYVGAGTSGRLGVLDASECPPTFQTPPEWVQGIIAGGELALRNSVEGAEDDPAAGREAIDEASVGSRDVVVGIAASGTTPFVWGALGEAKRRRARTALLCFNPFLRIPRRLRPDVLIAPNIGPEVLTGSTRLKAGTATKLVLNLLTTVSMVRIGKVMSNLMVDVRPANQKLRQRAVRIVEGLTGAPAATAELALARGGWDVRRAVRGLVRSDARRASRR